MKTWSNPTPALLAVGRVGMRKVRAATAPASAGRITPLDGKPFDGFSTVGDANRRGGRGSSPCRPAAISNSGPSPARTGTRKSGTCNCCSNPRMPGSDTCRAVKLSDATSAALGTTEWLVVRGRRLPRSKGGHHGTA